MVQPKHWILSFIKVFFCLNILQGIFFANNDITSKIKLFFFRIRHPNLWIIKAFFSLNILQDIFLANSDTISKINIFSLRICIIKDRFNHSQFIFFELLNFFEFKRIMKLKHASYCCFFLYSSFLFDAECFECPDEIPG